MPPPGALYAVLGQRVALHRVSAPTVGTVPSGDLRYLLVGHCHLLDHEAHRIDPAWRALQDEILEVGDLAIHDEEAFPEEAIGTRIGTAESVVVEVWWINGNDSDDRVVVGAVTAGLAPPITG